VHDDGRIWSGARWDIRQALGHTKADTIILDGSMNFPATTTPDLAQRTVNAAQSLDGTSAANAVRTRFTTAASSENRIAPPPLYDQSWSGGGRCPSGSSKPVRRGSPTLARFDSGAAPLTHGVDRRILRALRGRVRRR
jgi:hypothetical protein